VKYVNVDGKLMLWADLVPQRRKKAELSLFPNLKRGHPAESQRTAKGRLQQAILFED
jgi:hypothetical protein